MAGESSPRKSSTCPGGVWFGPPPVDTRSTRARNAPSPSRRTPTTRATPACPSTKIPRATRGVPCTVKQGKSTRAATRASPSSTSRAKSGPISRSTRGDPFLQSVAARAGGGMRADSNSWWHRRDPFPRRASETDACSGETMTFVAPAAEAFATGCGAMHPAALTRNVSEHNRSVSRVQVIPIANPLRAPLRIRQQSAQGAAEGAGRGGCRSQGPSQSTEVLRLGQDELVRKKKIGGP
jgi:hypothetical protein